MDIQFISFKKLLDVTSKTNINYTHPFHTPDYLKLFLKQFVNTKDLINLIIQKNSKILGLIAFECQKEGLILLGMKQIRDKEEITDYGDIIPVEIKESDFHFFWREVISFLKKQGYKKIQLDYIREDSFIMKYISELPGVFILKREVSPFIQLPLTWEEYLMRLERTKRKELKRKLKRLNTIPHTFSIHSASEKKVFNDFIALHKKSNAVKHLFMTESMSDFFWDLSHVPKHHFEVKIALLSIMEKPASLIYYFDQNKTCFVYNSGFDPDFRFYSPGLMSHAYLIKYNIEKNVRIHDFLRGNERYKYDLGATDLNLYKISINL